MISVPETVIVHFSLTTNSFTESNYTFLTNTKVQNKYLQINYLGALVTKSEETGDYVKVIRYF